MAIKKTKDFTAMYIRVPTALREQMEKSAALNERTLTGEVLFRLKKAYETAHKEIPSSSTPPSP